jgi:hypothetical protein
MDAGPMQFMFPESWNAGPFAGASGVEEQPMQ